MRKMVNTATPGIALRLPSGTDASPARRLVAAMVAQACDDIVLGGSVGRAAIAWVCEQRNERLWSFEWCCAVLGVDAARVRRSIWRRHSGATSAAATTIAAEAVPLTR